MHKLLIFILFLLGVSVLNAAGNLRTVNVLTVQNEYNDRPQFVYLV